MACLPKGWLAAVSEAKIYRAVAEREDGWWIVTVPELAP
ncbi:hypothetical protein HEB94_000856 [Actinopolymorpha pittospori]|uniref:Uncharacterized protein n=1 Tax=Actinopolymorpha pittospori TaxID=648752 RepID=A0A927RHZ2_9ACTN|nr:hypothetical protein [Actinopolymorpha pittospori]